MALEVVCGHHILPATVTEQHKRDEFNKRLIDAMRDNQYLRDVPAV